METRSKYYNQNSQYDILIFWLACKTNNYSYPNSVIMGYHTASQLAHWLQEKLFEFLLSNKNLQKQQACYELLIWLDGL